MTREEFESGVGFRMGYSIMEYKFNKDEKNSDPGYINCEGSYLCNVKRITKVGFTFYRFILGHRIAKKVQFKNLTKL